MQKQLKIHLQALQKALHDAGVWQTVAPNEQALQSTQPFAIDTLSATEWLQWIFLPRMYALLESGAKLPMQIAVTPYLEQALKDQPILNTLLQPMGEIEKLLQNQ